MDINRSNLITVKKDGHKTDTNMIFSTCNIQSIRFKELQLSELINDYSLDFLVFTETWLNAKQEHWKHTTILNRDGLSLITADRTGGKKGGGLALIHKSKYKATTINKGKKIHILNLQHGNLNLESNTLTVHGIYHPPPSLTNKITNATFIDEFLEFASNTLPEHQNNLYIGDFNLHCK